MDDSSQYRKRIEQALQRVFPAQVDTSWVTQMAAHSCPEARTDWANVFLEPGRELLNRGGKRWRPLVSVCVCEALGGGSSADLFSILAEIPHNGSLIVDDIEDASTTRRGGPAVHLVHGEDLSINMGNLMYFLPTFLFDDESLDDSLVAALSRDYMAALRRLHMGQGYDILWHREKSVIPDEASYLRMCRYKTGSLSGFAARIGVRGALGAGTEATACAERLGRAWESIGVGFQILDDVQNLSSGIPGKDKGDDIVEGKKSLPVILHCQSCPEDVPILVDLFERAALEAPQGDWTAVYQAIEVIQSSGAIEKAKEKAHALLKEGREAVVEQLPPGHPRDVLLGLLDQFIQTMV